MLRIFLILVSFLITVSAVSALEPRLTRDEQTVYEAMLKTSPDAAKEYRDTRGLLNACRQVLANRELAAEFDPPKNPNRKYVTDAESKIIDDCLDLLLREAFRKRR